MNYFETSAKENVNVNDSILSSRAKYVTYPSIPSKNQQKNKSRFTILQKNEYAKTRTSNSTKTKGDQKHHQSL